MIYIILCLIVNTIVRAGIALTKGEPSQAIRELQDVAQYELGFCAVVAPLYLRAETYLQQGSNEQAAEEFQRILNHRGSEPFSTFCAVARQRVAERRQMVART